VLKRAPGNLEVLGYLTLRARDFIGQRGLRLLKLHRLHRPCPALHDITARAYPLLSAPRALVDRLAIAPGQPEKRSRSRVQ
jgi:hypothetical protein